MKSFPFPDLLLHLSAEIEEFATFAEYVGPQLIKQGSVSELMKQIRQTEVIKAAVEYQGEVRERRPGEAQAGKGRKGAGPPPQESLRAGHDRRDSDASSTISDEEALYIKQVTEEKTKDPAIRTTVQAHREDRRLSRRSIPRAGQRRDSDRLRRARTLRRIGRPEIHGHRRHLRHHGRDGDPDIISGTTAA